MALNAAYVDRSGFKAGNPWLDKAIATCEQGAVAANSAVLQSNAVIYKTIRGDVAPLDWQRLHEHLPGMVMTEDESIIEFTTDRICPAYVTILTGTTVTWRNLAGAPETVTLTTEDGTIVTEQLLEPGAEYKYRFDVAGRTIYRVASIPTFTGIIEVQD